MKWWRKSRPVEPEPPQRVETGIERMEREAPLLRFYENQKAIAADRERIQKRIDELEAMPQVQELYALHNQMGQLCVYDRNSLNPFMRWEELQRLNKMKAIAIGGIGWNSL